MEGKVVNSYNEWDPLEEVIVGTLEGATCPPWEISRQAVTHEVNTKQMQQHHLKYGGRPIAKVYSAEELQAAQRNLDEFIHILESEGIKVRRPDMIDMSRVYGTPEWTSNGCWQTVPRDVLIVIGDEIIESTMAMRSRYYEFLGYRSLIKEYFKKGARWTTAPKPQMNNELYDYEYERGPFSYVTTEFEPVFDAADIARCGKDLFVQRSQVTNEFGIEWLRRHFGEQYNVHLVEFAEDTSLHIDATFVPLVPGKLLVNPDRPIKEMPPMFERAGWEVIVAPRTTLPNSDPNFLENQWLHMNVLMLDEERVIVEKNEEPLIKCLKDLGLKPILCNFRDFYPFGGSVHCATCDIRRRGNLQSYF